MDQRLATVDCSLTGIAGRLEALDRQILDLRRVMRTRFADLYRPLERLEHTSQAVAQVLQGIEAGLADERRRRATGRPATSPS